jgi:hypothetical protein
MGQEPLATDGDTRSGTTPGSASGPPTDLLARRPRAPGDVSDPAAAASEPAIAATAGLPKQPSRRPEHVSVAETELWFG